MFVYGCAVCIYGRITMTNVRCGKHLKWTPPCHMRHTPTPHLPRLAQRTGTASNPILWGYITYEPSATQTFCKYFVKLGENIRNIYRFAQHITHLISILVLLLSSLLTNVQEREYWYNLIGFLSRPTLDPLCFGGHLSRKEPKAKSSRRSFVILPCMLCFASLVSIVSLSNPIHISLYSLFAKGLSLTNVGDLRGNKDLSILITVEHGLIVRK